MIPFNRPFQAPNEAQLVRQALDSGHISGDGPFTRQASQWLAQHFGPQAQVLLTTSGTHALELGVLLMGLGPQDEVVMPSFTFSSTANAVALRGARLRFADINPQTFSMGLAELQAACTEHTTAVVAMPYGGVSADMDQIADWCRSRGLKFMEDNAHGLFATLHDKPMGSFAPVSALSFHQTKNISCGEGGALVLNDTALAQAAEIIREKGTDRSRFLRGEVDKYTWRQIGSSYLPSDILAAVLWAQLQCAQDIQRKRTALWQTYRDALAPVAPELGIELQHIPDGLQHPAHVFALLVPNAAARRDVLAALRQHGVKATSHYEPLHQAPAHSGCEALPHTDTVASRLIRLPLYAQLPLADAQRVAEALITVLRG